MLLTRWPAENVYAPKLARAEPWPPTTPVLFWFLQVMSCVWAVQNSTWFRVKTECKNTSAWSNAIKHWWITSQQDLRKALQIFWNLGCSNSNTPHCSHQLYCVDGKEELSACLVGLFVCLCRLSVYLFVSLSGLSVCTLCPAPGLRGFLKVKGVFKMLRGFLKCVKGVSKVTKGVFKVSTD